MQKHASALATIIQDKTNWTDLKIELSKLNVNGSDTDTKTTIAGKLFEVFAKHYFTSMPGEIDTYKNVWYYNEIPLMVRTKLRLPDIDHGMDLLLEDYDEKYIAVQCKFKNDESGKLGWNKDKIANLFACCPGADGYTVFANVSDLADVIKNRYDSFSFYGIADLLQIDQNAFENIYKSIIGSQITYVHKVPFPHQTDAINACVAHFEMEPRGQLILPCGAGKTLTALWIKEKLESNLTLVLVPSLALLKQIKNDWAKERKLHYRYVCVCSETDIDSEQVDPLIHHTYEIGGNVKFTSTEIRLFLEGSDDKVIFSTYQSLGTIAAAVKGTNVKFDFVFCDEAHKTAGIGNNTFGLIHNDINIPAKKRLYATATPRIVSNAVKMQLAEKSMYAYDMSDPTIFGTEIYRMSFKDAIEKNILVDYQIIAIGVNDQQIQEHIKSRTFTDSKVSIDEAANNYALEFVMNNYNAKHALSFHSRVRSAEKFAERHNNLFNDFESFSISGSQTTSQRNIILQAFKSLEKSVIANARCLTEGVDVPAIDLVYFCDPKNSKVDIVQAVGRALRKKEGKVKGFVVVPVYHSNKGDLEASIAVSVFDNLIQVIRSLCEHDERLQAEINTLALNKGKRELKHLKINGFTENVDTLMLVGFEEKLTESLFDQIIEKAYDRWEFRYAKIVDARNLNPNRWPVYDKGNPNSEESEMGILCEQVRKQYKKRILNKYWESKFEEIDFNFDGRDDNWIEAYNKIIEILDSKASFRQSELATKDYMWIRRYVDKLKKNELNEERTKLMLALGWEKIETNQPFEYYMAEIVEWKNQNGMLPSIITNKKLYTWLSNKRVQYKKGKIFTSEEIESLRSVGFNLDLDQKKEEEKKWNEKFSLLKTYFVDNQKWPTPKTNPKLYNWCQSQRQRQAGTASNGKTAKLRDEQAKMLDDINFVWIG